MNKHLGGTRPGHQEKGHQQHDGRMRKTFGGARSRDNNNNYNKKPLFADIYGGTKYSFTSSYVKNDVAILGATFTAAQSASHRNPQNTATPTQIGPQSTVQPGNALHPQNAPQGIDRTTILDRATLHSRHLHLPPQHIKWICQCLRYTP